MLSRFLRDTSVRAQGRRLLAWTRRVVCLCWPSSSEGAEANSCFTAGRILHASSTLSHGCLIFLRPERLVNFAAHVHLGHPEDEYFSDIWIWLIRFLPYLDIRMHSDEVVQQDLRWFDRIYTGNVIICKILGRPGGLFAFAVQYLSVIFLTLNHLLAP